MRVTVGSSSSGADHPSVSEADFLYARLLVSVTLSEAGPCGLCGSEMAFIQTSLSYGIF